MFGLGLWEIAAIALVAVLFIKPADIPKVARFIGRIYGTLTQFARSSLKMLREMEADSEEKGNPKE